MSVKVRRHQPAFDAWKYPAPQLATLSAMPKWLAPMVETAGDPDSIYLHVADKHAERFVEVGQWVVLVGHNHVEVYDEAEFLECFEVVSGNV